MTRTARVEAGNPTWPTDAEYREPPNNIEAEQALLGAILVNNGAAAKVSGFLEPEHFFEPVHGRIYRDMLALIQRGLNADAISLKTYFERDDALADVDGASYLKRLDYSTVTVVNAADYGEIIHDHYLRRELIRTGENAVRAAYDARANESAVTMIEELQRDLDTIGGGGGTQRKGFRSWLEVIAEALAATEKAYKGGGVVGVATGLIDLDAKLGGGLENGALVVVGGVTAMGKTLLGGHVAVHAARTTGAVAWFSLEMSAAQTGQRAIAAATSTALTAIRSGNLSELQASEVFGNDSICDLPIHFDDSRGITVHQIRSRALQLHRRVGGVALVVVDHLQLVAPDGRYRGSRVAEVSQITMILKALAGELDCPLLMLSQLSRKVEERPGKRPLLSDLRESGSIEQDADVVMLPSYPPLTQTSVHHPATRCAGPAWRSRANLRSRARQ